MSLATAHAPQVLEYVPLLGVSPDSEVVTERWRETERHYRFPVTRRSRDDAERFHALAEMWRNDVLFTSSVTEMVLHPAYQRIIGMGVAAVPFLLRELERRPDHWFWALTAITGADPVKPEHRGKLREMAQAWLQWGKEQGLRW